MYTRLEKISAALLRLPVEIVRELSSAREKAEVERVDAVATAMAESGAEVVAVDAGAAMTPDGREVLWVDGTPWALRPEVHAERLAQAFEEAKKQRSEAETKSVVGTESLSQLVCPKCGDALQHTSVCPKCSAGKLGYRHRYTCVCGGADLVSKEAL